MIIDKLIEKARNNRKNIVLVETDDVRTIEAASIVKKLNFANNILVGKENEIYELAKINNLDIEGIRIINPETSELTEELINKFYEIRKSKGTTLEEASEIIKNDYR